MIDQKKKLISLFLGTCFIYLSAMQEIERFIPSPILKELRQFFSDDIKPTQEYEWDRPVDDPNEPLIPKDFHLVEIKEESPHIIVDMKYTTYDNSAGFPVSAETECLVSRRVMDKLNKIQDELEQLGFGLKVFDAYRPLYVEIALYKNQEHHDFISKEFYHFCRRNGYIPTQNIWPHRENMFIDRTLPLIPFNNRGAMVAVTLVTHDGIELEMPTKFDDRSEKADPQYTEKIPDYVIKHRKLLADVMLKHGFRQAETWYDFYDEDARNFPQQLYLEFTTAEDFTIEQKYLFDKILKKIYSIKLSIFLEDCAERLERFPTAPYPDEYRELISPDYCGR